MKWVYFFAKGQAEGSAEMRELLGGKGAGLHEMCRIGLPVPPGFTITTEACVYYFQHGNKWPEGLREQVYEAMARLEEVTGKRFGDPNNPLLVSVRSGARASMPGMMDTVLNLGINEEIARAMGEIFQDPRFAADSYRRFIAMFGDVVLGLKPKKGETDPFDAIMEEVKHEHGRELDTDLTAEELMEVAARSRYAIKKALGLDVPSDPKEQLEMAINAVFRSWMNERAIEYRRIYKLPDDWGTAVNVQTMVFGNMGPDSGTGVAFTRNPATGENELYGEFLMNAQGEDVVAGMRTPVPIEELRKLMPDIYAQLEGIRNILERHYKDMQDLEFTIERGKLYILQTRAGKRTGLAAMNIALDMLEEGIIDERTAITRIEPDQITTLLRPVFDEGAKKKAKEEKRLIATGLPAGPGAASGRVCFFSDEVEEKRNLWGRIILVRTETSPEDIKGMELSEGILTSRGGMTSHAALVARQRGKTCIVGCSALEIDYKNRQIRVGDTIIKEGEQISIDGSTGEVFLGEIDTRPSEVIEVLIHKTRPPDEAPVYKRFKRIMELADRFRRLGVRANADRPSEAETAITFGAEGIGLCRTEHMFFEGERIDHMREMILAETEDERIRALDKLLPLQREDFKGIFRVMKGRPVTIRTLDPPLHEFLPNTEGGQRELAEKLGLEYERVKARVEELHEANPMLGHRGCRLGITHPEITEMQARAIFEAACAVKKEGIDVKPEVMIPLVGNLNEFRNQEAIVRRVAEEVFEREGVRVDYSVGTMIELPRAAVMADEIAQGAEFFSFGTNDLTQTGFGISRDDYGKFIQDYIAKGIFKFDPFISIEPGIGELVRIGVERGRKTRPDLKIGICGEHGGDPDSITFCHSVGLDYVSCSPFRVPVARLAAARAAITEGQETEA
ncbi:MAG: pyruvate, phosphate dikinase [candidate division WOR-3 bacterium]